MKFCILVLISLCSVVFANVKVDLEGWNKTYSKDNLTFYSKKIPNSKLLAFKAVGILPINMGKMMAALRTVDSTIKWDKNTVRKITVQEISDIEAITYSESKIPWPFYNRDVVLHNKLFLDKKEQIFYVISRSVEHKAHPAKQNLVRAQINYARFRTKPIDKNKTYVEFEVHADPMGVIPNWIVNSVQKDFPYDFLRGLTNYCKKADLKPNPGVQKMIDEYFALTGNKLW